MIPPSSAVIAPVENLDRYLLQIRKFPLLAAQEERRLAENWRDHGDRAAADRLVTSHMRLAAKLAIGYRGYGLPLADLISEGNVGLIRAVERFDPTRGFRLSTYAMWWIRAAIQEYILRSWSLVKMGTTGAQKSLFFNLRRLKGQIRAAENGEMSGDWVRQIAERLNVEAREVIEMDHRMAGRDSSLNVQLTIESDDEWQDRLVDESDDQEARLAEREVFLRRQRVLNAGMETLSARERDIVVERRLRERPATLEILGRKHGVSRERIRQIELRAIEKLQKSVKAAIAESRSNRVQRLRPVSENKLRHSPIRARGAHRERDRA